MWRPLVTMTPGSALLRWNKLPLPFCRANSKRASISMPLRSSVEPSTALSSLSSVSAPWLDPMTMGLLLFKVIVFDSSYNLCSISGSSWTARRYSRIASNTFPHFSSSVACRNNDLAWGWNLLNDRWYIDIKRNSIMKNYFFVACAHAVFIDCTFFGQFLHLLWRADNQFFLPFLSKRFQCIDRRRIVRGIITQIHYSYANLESRLQNHQKKRKKLKCRLFTSSTMFGQT